MSEARDQTGTNGIRFQIERDNRCGCGGGLFGSDSSWSDGENGAHIAGFSELSGKLRHQIGVKVECTRHEAKVFSLDIPAVIQTLPDDFGACSRSVRRTRVE